MLTSVMYIVIIYHMKRTLQPIICKLCGETHPSNGIQSHLKWKHNEMTTEEYIKLYGDFRVNTKKADALKEGKELYTCKLCGDNKTYTTTALSFHVIKVHKLTKEEYILNNLLGGVVPTCKCGCGEKTKILSFSPPYCREYSSGHNKSTLGYKFTAESKEKMSEKATARAENFKKNGLVAPWHSEDALKKRGDDFHKKSLLEKETKHNIKILSETGSKIEFSCNICGSVYSQFHSAYFTCLKCNPPVRSKAQTEIYDYIKNELRVSDAVMNHRKTFEGSMEIDVFSPSKMLGVEFDGLYYHSEVAGLKPKSYHIWKTQECQSKGIRLIHIFEDEWRDNKEIIQSKLKSIFGNTDGIEKIYARKCIVKDIPWADTSEFLQKNHIQGSVPTSVSIGLFYKDILVSVATFGKPTVVRGNKTMKLGEWELMRMVTDINKHVTGSNRKIVVIFHKNHKPERIISYADRRFTSSEHNVYKAIGFSLVSEGTPNYFYMNDYKHRLHRFNFTKGKLVESGADPKKTEWQIMQEIF